MAGSSFPDPNRQCVGLEPIWTGAPDDGLEATGATAGIPGTWTPPGSSGPASILDLMRNRPNKVTASPATAWTTGQFVQTMTPGAPGRATWTGTAWVGGVAADPEDFDPGEHTVAEVEAYIAEHPDQRDAVLTAEADGKARVTLVGET